MRDIFAQGSCRSQKKKTSERQGLTGGHARQIPQRDAIPTTVKLWLCSISCKSSSKTAIPSWVHMDPVWPWSNNDPASVTLAPLPHSHFVLYHTGSEARCIVIVPLFFHALTRVCTGRHDTPYGLFSSRGRDPLMGSLGPSLSLCPILTKPPYLLLHCYNSISCCTTHAVRLGV